MYVWFNKRTVERAAAQVELRTVVAELADVARQREAGLVVTEIDPAALRLHADELERELACAHRDSLLNSLPRGMPGSTHTYRGAGSRRGRAPAGS